MEYQSFVTGKRFFDNVHFPRGFGRSGIFSVKETQIIESTGVLVRQLAEGTAEPADDVQRELLKVVLGSKEAETPFEKLWKKYYQHISTKRCPMNLSSSNVGIASSSSDDGGYMGDDF